VDHPSREEGGVADGGGEGPKEACRGHPCVTTDRSLPHKGERKQTVPYSIMCYVFDDDCVAQFKEGL
jgi:hypothetical protein